MLTPKTDFTNLCSNLSRIDLNCRPLRPIVGICKELQHFKTSWSEEIAIGNREIDQFNHIMKLCCNKEIDIDIDSVLNNRWWSILKTKLKSHKERKKQHAFAVIFMKNGKYWIFKSVKPHRHNRNKTEQTKLKYTKHSEEVLIGQIDKFLSKNEDKVESVLIYSLYSPCFVREKKVLPCMFLLWEKAYEWHRKYGCFTDVAFTKFWGLKGTHFLKDLTYSQIICLNSLFYPTVEECEKIPFKLDIKQLKKSFRKIFETIRSAKDKLETRNEKKTGRAFKELKELAETLKRRQEHLDHGKEKIESLKFESDNKFLEEALKKIWNEVVDNSPLPHFVTQKIDTDFKTNVVKFFQKYYKSFWGSYPLKLYHISPEFNV